MLASRKRQVSREMAERNGKQIVNAGAYATATDFRRIFTEDVNSLYLLALLLTGSPEKAEECFVEGIGESTKEHRVFKEWARSWARRTIIRSAIRLVAPRESIVATGWTDDVARVMGISPYSYMRRSLRFSSLHPLSASFSSCPFSNGTRITIVPFSWVARTGK
jgi:hypothetical protein